jgi:hypothetical protein
MRSDEYRLLSAFARKRESASWPSSSPRVDEAKIDLKTAFVRLTLGMLTMIMLAVLMPVLLAVEMGNLAGYVVIQS